MGPLSSLRSRVRVTLRHDEGTFQEAAARDDRPPPGPMNRGVEIAPEVADDPGCPRSRPGDDGVAVRMAVLFQLLGGEHE